MVHVKTCGRWTAYLHIPLDPVVVNILPTNTTVNSQKGKRIRNGQEGTRTNVKLKTKVKECFQDRKEKGKGYLGRKLWRVKIHTYAEVI